MADPSQVSVRLKTMELVENVDRYTKETGKNRSELFNEAIQFYLQKEVVEGANAISPSLAKTFKSDLVKLDNALDVIRNVYTGQMQGLRAKLDVHEQEYMAKIESLQTAHAKQTAELNGKIEVLQESLKVEAEAKHRAEQAQKRR